jgi:NhaA family Na+:H+ antiporter
VIESPRPPIERMLGPLNDFTRSNVAGGVVLIAAALVALVLANSPLSDSYHAIWRTPLTVGFGDIVVAKPLDLWINDGLMAAFFLLVGLEIKREVLVGELGSLRRAALPLGAAAGGAIVPALIFLAIAGGSGEGARGWGVPMATDIAFALGVLALLGRRVPANLRVFVTALAIGDDLLAVMVIALFYTAELSVVALATAGGLLGALVLANLLGVRRPVVYAVLGIGLWLALLESGVHATIAGVLLAMTIPARQRIAANELVPRAYELIEDASRTAPGRTRQRHAALWELESLTDRAQAPMLRIEHGLAPWVAFVIVPLFALANAGVALSVDLGALVGDPVVVGVVLGLVVGKQLGITGAAWLMVRAGVATLPHGVSWWQIYGAAWVCGIGFTMSLFIADLAYAGSAQLDQAKLGILAASVIAGMGGYLLLRVRAPRKAPRERSGQVPEPDVGG